MAMSPTAALTVPALRDFKQAHHEAPLVMLTAYDHPTARIASQADADLLLVGDSAAMVVLGHDSTTSISLDEMVMFCGAVRRGAHDVLVVGDLPFGSYQSSSEQAVDSAVRLVREGRVDIVKLEGAGVMVERVAAIVAAGIPVMAHLGLTPQTAVALGGFTAQARDESAARQLLEDARQLADAGACAIVLEAIPAAVATAVTEALSIPTIGIGAGSGTDGQVIVFHDVVGLTTGPAPKFVERYMNADELLTAGVSQWVDDVREHRYPAERHTYAARTIVKTDDGHGVPIR